MGKKEKKSKKKKSRKRSRSYSSSSSSDSDRSPKKSLKSKPSVAESSSNEKIQQREEWMDLAGSLSSSYFSRTKDKKKDEQSRATAITEKPGQSSRELNPYWKNGGTGLPQEHQESKSSSTMDAEWLRKSLRRAEEQAIEQGKSLEEVAAERWGSLDAIKSMIADAEKKDRRYSKFDHKSSYTYQKERNRSFRKPNDDSSLRMRESNRSSSQKTKRWQKPDAKETVRQSETVSQSEIVYKSEDPCQSESTNKDTESNFLYSEAEMNKLGAKIVKAEIMGNHELANQLKQQLEEARKCNSAAKDNTKNAETVTLTRMDQRGVERPLMPRDQSEYPSGRSGKKKISETHVSGERVRYFADDDKYSLQEMFQREKGRSASEDDAMFAKMVSKSKDMDEMFEQRISQRNFSSKQDNRDRMSAIKEHQKMSTSLDSCEWCIESKNMIKHMIVAMDSTICLSLPAHDSLVPGHCVLSPIQHIPCQVQLDEDVWERLQEYKKALVNMFKNQNKSPVFFEVFKGHRKFPHMRLQCVPLPVEIASEAPMYFKKALLECETEWSTNKKVVDLYKKNVRHAIPKGLPYFAVNFANEGGYGHVIEDSQMFPSNFAEEIIGGMLDLDHSSWRKPKKEKFDEQKIKVLEFTKVWKNYDPNSAAG